MNIRVEMPEDLANLPDPDTIAHNLIDQIVNKLYGLTNEQVKTIEESFVIGLSKSALSVKNEE